MAKELSIDDLLRFAFKNKASDLHISAGLPPMIRVDGEITKINMPPLDHQKVHSLIYDIMNDKQRADYEEFFETDFSFEIPNVARFRVNAFNQNRGAGAVFRTIPSEVLTMEQLGMGPIFEKISNYKRGVVLVTGPTGSGKSTTLAAMINYINETRKEHILTIEDPIEYLHEHKGCIITQREVGIDTKSFEAGLKNTLRQAPDVILIGEIRTRETMDYAIQYAETGHLVFATLHATNANQALERIIHFFEAKHHEQILMDLSLNLRAIVAQQLIATPDGKGRRPAIEILLNSQLIGDYIRKGEIHEIKPVMKRSREIGMQTFDQALFDLYENGDITYRDAIQHADSPNDLRLLIKLESKSANKTEESELELSLQSDDNSAANDNAIS